MTQAAPDITPPPVPETPPPSPAAEPDPAETEKSVWAGMSQWQLIAHKFSHHRLAVLALNILILLYSVALFAEFFAPYPSVARHLDHAYCPPQMIRWSPAHGLHVRALRMVMDPVTLRRTYSQDPGRIIKLSFFAPGRPVHLWGIIPLERRFLGVSSRTLAEDPQASFFFLGADRYGRDILSRMIYGSRISLSVGLIGIVFTFILGMSIGGVSGYVGGKTDNFIQRAIEVINSFPHLPLWLAMGAAMPADWSPLRVYFVITLVLALLGWTGLARVVRGKILSLREEDYVTAARLLGAGHGRILFKHLIPGFASHIIVALSLAVPGMILGETSLSFLGLGLRPPVVSWGVMLQDCMDIQAVRYYPWLLLPVAFIVATVLSFNFVGDGLRDAADPYSSR